MGVFYRYGVAGLLASSLVFAVQAQTFTQVTTGAIVSDGGHSFGHSWGDFNGDEYLDLVVNNIVPGEDNFFYQNNGDGTFARIPLVAAPGPSTSSTWGDYNNDGLADLFIANGGTGGSATNFLFDNSGSGLFAAVTHGDPVNTTASFTASSWVDVDNDGYLDLFVGRSGAANLLYRNQHDGTFAATTLPDGGGTWGVSFADYDNDGDMDFYAANWGRANYFYRNDNGTFARLNGPITGSSERSVSASWGDMDNDGDLDLFVSNVGARNWLYRNDGGGTMTAITTGPVVTPVANSESSCWGDIDNDGDLDLLVSGGGNVSVGRNHVYLNDGSGQFTPLTTGTLVTLDGRYEGLSCVDLDNDGDLDVFISNYSGRNNLLFHNDGNANQWLLLQAVGTASNPSGLGVRARLKATIKGQAVWQLREVTGATGHVVQGDLRMHFGLGDAARIDSLILEWPSGHIDRFGDLAPARTLRAREGQGLSEIRTGLDTQGSLEPRFKLEIFPIPWQNQATLHYQLAAPGAVRVQLFDGLGRAVSTLVDEVQHAGSHTASLDANNLANGLYLIRIHTATGTATAPLVLTR